MVMTTRDVELEKAKEAEHAELLLELEFLRYFYDEVDSSLGPASDDVYEIITENYTGTLPANYERES